MNIMRKNSGQWLIGLVILVVGVIFLVENITGNEVWEKVWPFWPIILILWGLTELFQKRSIFFAIILLAIGIVFLLKNLDLYHWSDSIWKFWPVIIIALGFDHLINKSDTYIARQGPALKSGKKIITQDDEII